jgi:hypothetical protein
MSKPTKYIRNQHRFIVFPDSCQHREMAIKALGPDKLIHGAGFMRLGFNEGKIEADCYGHSESLNKYPRHDDHEAILKGIGVENDSEVEHAKYISWRGKVIVFCNELEHKAVAEAAFFGSTDCESAGFVKFIPRDDGTIKLQCYGESMSLNVGSSPDDVKAIADLMELPENVIFKPATKKII